MKISPRLLAPLINCFYRLWCTTLRITETGREAIDILEADGKPMVFSLWHNEFFALMHVRRSLRIICVVSASNDGEYLARLLEALGLRTARGSSSRGGLKALLHTARMMRNEGYNACLTVDGPRGPRHVVKEGAVFLAMQTPAYIVPIRLISGKAKVFKSWDKFRLPMLFSKVHIVYGTPYLPQSTDITAENIEMERMILQQHLESIDKL